MTLKAQVENIRINDALSLESEIVIDPVNIMDFLTLCKIYGRASSNILVKF